jgi:hypothetical protein
MKIYAYPIRPGAGFRIQRLHRKILYNMPRGQKTKIDSPYCLVTKDKVSHFRHAYSTVYLCSGERFCKILLPMECWHVYIRELAGKI